MRRASAMLVMLGVIVAVSLGVLRSDATVSYGYELRPLVNCDTCRADSCCTWGGYVYESDGITPVDGAWAKAEGVGLRVMDSTLTDYKGCYCMKNVMVQDWYWIFAYKGTDTTDTHTIWHEGGELQVVDDLVMY